MKLPPSPGDLQAIYEGGLAEQRDRYGAAEATVEAVMAQLRENGLTALLDLNCQERLANLSPRQIAEVIERLGKLRDRYPLINDRLLDKLGGLQ